MRKKDLKFLVKSILKEIREYNISKDKEVLLYDFYVLSYIRTLNFDSSKPSKISGFADEPDKYGGFFGKDPEELKSVISDAEKKLIPVLKKDLLDSVYYSICCEMRHALDKKQNVDTDYPEFKKRHPKAYEYVKQLQSAWNSSGESFSRIESFKVANDIFSENDRYEFVKASGEIFENWKWGTAYGGKNWKDICDAWLYLDKAGSIMESIVCIDNLYHQQHNTGSVLNKVASYSKSGYSKSGSYAWLAKALEDKAVNWWNTPWKLLPKCSSDMRRIALMAFKKAGVNIGNVDPSQFLTNKQKPSSKPLENVINSHMYNLLKDIKNELEKNETIKSKGIKFEMNYQSYWKGSLTILFASTPDWKINIQKEGDGYKITDKIKTDGVFKSPSHIKKALIDWAINSIEFSLGIKINTSSKSRSDLNAKTESVLKDLSGSFIHLPNSNLNPTKLRILYKKSDNLNPDKLKISYKKSDNLEPNSGIYYIYLYEDMTNFKFIQIVVPLSPYNSQNLYRITVENGGEKTYPADIDLEDTLKNIIKTIIKSSKNVDVEITSSKQFSIDNKSQSKKRSDNLKLAKTVAEVVKDKYYNNKLKEIAEINNIPVDSD